MHSISPPPSLYGAVYKLVYTLVHFVLSFGAALFYQDISRQRRPLPTSPCCNDDLERGDTRPIQVAEYPAAAMMRQGSSSSVNSNASRSRRVKQQHRRSNSKKNVQFKLPTRACPPLGRIDILSPDASKTSDNRSPVRRSFDRIRSTAANPRAHHATYFLD